VATYTNNTPLFVPNDQTRDSVLPIPSGRTAVQSMEVTGIKITWPASSQELSTRLISPDGSIMFLWEVGCGAPGFYPPNTNFTISDAGTQPADGTDGHCTDEFLVGGTLRPDGPPMDTKPMSFFNGKAPSGDWTLRAVDSGAGFVNQGTITSWSLRVVHAPPTFKTSAPKKGKVKKKLKLTAEANADGTVKLGGGAKASSAKLTAGQPTQIAYKPTKKVLKKVRKKGKARVTINLDFTDETGGTAKSSVKVTLKG
jgi:hypothetical protein